MTPHKDGGVGTFVIDRRFRGVGRVKVASGTAHAKTFEKINATLDLVVDRGRIDLVRAVRDRVITPMELYDALRVNRLETLPTAETIRQLQRTMTAWTAALSERGGAGASRDSVANHRQSLRYLVKDLPYPERLVIQQLPERLADLRKTMHDRARTFNQVKSTAQAFVRDELGIDHALWKSVAAVRSLSVTPTRKRNPQSIPALFAIAERMPAPWGTMALQMACSGMGTKEYLTDGWDIGPDRVFIHGVKRESRDRTVPLVQRDVMKLGDVRPEGMSAERASRLLNRALKTASGDTVRAYDLRRTFSNLLEAAQIPRTRRRLYMGHGAKDVTDLYEQHEVSAFLADDAAAIERYIESARNSETPSITTRKHA